jgi:RNA polymerase sigma factor (sigma-70 family)
MLALLQRRGDRIADPRAFLIGAICNVSRAYWRLRKRMTDVEGARLDAVALATVASDAGRIEQQLVMRRVLDRLHPTRREVLRLHYYEHLSASEVARRLDVSHGYAEKLIVRALRNARAIYAELTAGDGLAPVIQTPQQRRRAAARDAERSQASSGSSDAGVGAPEERT